MKLPSKTKAQAETLQSPSPLRSPDTGKPNRAVGAFHPCWLQEAGEIQGFILGISTEKISAAHSSQQTATSMWKHACSGFVFAFVNAVRVRDAQGNTLAELAQARWDTSHCHPGSATIPSAPGGVTLAIASLWPPAWEQPGGHARGRG